MTIKKKALIFVPAGSGHVNPMCSIAHELVKNQNMQVIFFGVEKFKNIIEKAGCEYREYENGWDMDKDTKEILEKNLSILFIFTILMDQSARLLPSLIKTCEEEKPDLIIHDFLTLPARYLVSYLETQVSKNSLSYKMPKILNFFPSFAQIDGIYPNKDELKLITGEMSFRLFYDFMHVQAKQIYMNYKLRINVKGFPKFLGISENYMNICCVFQELQPRVDNFKEKVEFVGCCIAEEVRDIEIKNEKLKNILSQFKQVNPVDLSNMDVNQKKLIYVSLGTTFNKNIGTFEKIIDAFKSFDDEDASTKSQIKFSDLEIVVSAGSEVYRQFQAKIINENYQLPENILLMESVPQIEILKRASLFVTHAGMNSTSETIQYGVPVICIPASADQPLVALRICDELKLGIKHDVKKFTPSELRSSVHKVLGDSKYLENILELSKISRSYNGCKNAGKIISDYINC